MSDHSRRKISDHSGRESLIIPEGKANHSVQEGPDHSGREDPRHSGR